MPFQAKSLELSGLLLITPTVHEDPRGFFMETFKASEFAALGLAETFVQDTHSRSQRGVLRGLHFQQQRPRGKIVRVIRGEIFDAVVDIRPASPTFGRWTGLRLSEQNRRMLYIPPGFAHGFGVLSESADILYKMTREYDPHDERRLLWNDPDIGIAWPIQNPIISEKDSRGVLLKDWKG